jgi:hypothetical protein
MHQSPQKQVGNRRDKYVAAFPVADDDSAPQMRQHRTSQGKVRSKHWRDEGPRDNGRGRQPPRA